MEGYLGEFDTDLNKDLTREEWAMYFIESYGQIDGGHHKNWVIDQVVRVLKGTAVIRKEARWDNGLVEGRFNLGEPSQEYLDWVVEMCDGEDGPETYGYDEGVAP